MGTRVKIVSMVDMHCHLLPGVDDGAHSLVEACAMAEMAAADGITQVVATPHCNARYPFSLERNRTLLAELASATRARFHLSSGKTQSPVDSLHSSLTVLLTKRIIIGNTAGVWGGDHAQSLAARPVGAP